MPHPMIADDEPDATDAQWDTCDRAMAERFGSRVRQMLRERETDVREMARLAASYASRTLRPRQTIRRSHAIRRAHAIAAVQERVEIVAILLTQGRVHPDALLRQTAGIVDSVLAILRGGSHE